MILTATECWYIRKKHDNPESDQPFCFLSICYCPGIFLQRFRGFRVHEQEGAYAVEIVGWGRR